MSSGVLETPGGAEQLCVLLLSGVAEEQEEVKRREVGCQWESPEERREVGCQSDTLERRDAGIQVDLLTHQMSWRHSGSSSNLLQCFTVRPDGPDGGALLQHCTSTRTKTIASPPTPRTKIRTRSRGRLPPQSTDKPRQNPTKLRRSQVSPGADVMVQEEELEEEQEEVMLEDCGDPTWTPPDGDEDEDLQLPSSPAAPGDVQTDSESQHAPVLVVKLEPDSTMCDICGKVMKNKSSLARHSFIHTGKKPFACHLCDLRFNRRDNLQHHLSRLHPNGVAKLEKQRHMQPWLCAICGKTFSCRSRLKTHEVIHSGVKPHGCDLCPKAYMRTNDLEHHKKMVHSNGSADSPQPSSLLCDFCGKEFKCRSQLAVHLQTHTGERPHLCDICGRKFARQYQLKRHKLLVHANGANGPGSELLDLPFSCGVCGKRLYSEELLAAHTRTHTAERPHRCTLCLRSFQRATCLKQHHVRVHLKVQSHEARHRAGRRRSAALDNDDKVFPCSVCGKVFRFRSLLVSHSLIHSEIRPFACDFCSRSFRRHSHLKRHREVVHANGARPPQSFVCHICGKDKKCRSQLARHIIIHTGERPYACDLCTARFNRHGNLQQHRRRMHGVGRPPDEEVAPILFDDDTVAALTYKQEETVVTVDTT